MTSGLTASQPWGLPGSLQADWRQEQGFGRATRGRGFPGRGVGTTSADGVLEDPEVLKGSDRFTQLGADSLSLINTKLQGKLKHGIYLKASQERTGRGRQREAFTTIVIYEDCQPCFLWIPHRKIL